ncbi:hypothetical protein F2Q70_00017560 [Brassica cretica]|uniref:Uncharacterized protein n=1 Tax=Brassica cretica TaxID=69181 RepID=A0A8S9I1D5_BRACR|nr:hypothetical protein F2Q70_00017560 [Brassica cretica]
MLPLSPLPVGGVLGPLQLTVESFVSNTVTCCSQSKIRNIFHLEEHELLTTVALKWDDIQVKRHHKRINMKNWEVLSSIYGNSSDAEYIIEQELTFVFHLDGLKGIVMYLIEPPGGIFSSLVVGDRFHVQDSLSDNVKNVFLKLWPPETDKAVWSIKFCPSLPWLYLGNIRCDVFLTEHDLLWKDILVFCGDLDVNFVVTVFHPNS